MSCRSTIPTKVLRDGETGEIAIRGPNVTRGYWNRPEETAQAFIDDCFLTGDIGYRDETATSSWSTGRRT